MRGVNAASMKDLADARISRVTLVMCCLFGAYGMVLPFLSRWLEIERGLDGAQIGVVLSMAQLARIIIGPAIALMADGARDRRTPLRLLSTAALICFVGFFFVAKDFGDLVLWGFFALTFSQTAAPFIEAASLRAADEGKISYGIARGVGSSMFIVANVAGGALVATFGLGAVAVWIVGAYASMAASSWFALQPDPAPRQEDDPSTRGRLGVALGLLRKPGFLFVILSCGLIQCAHAFYYTFSTIIWRGQGVSSEAIGVLWAIGVAVEVALLWSMPFIERRASPESLILLGAGGGALRWLAMGFAPTGMVLWPLQALHALSFACTHVGAMRLIYQQTPPGAAGLPQTLHAALSGGLLMGVATLLSGVLYDRIGAQGYWAMAALCLVGGLLALPLLRPNNVVKAL